jgi:hypothetical protein
MPLTEFWGAQVMFDGSFHQCDLEIVLEIYTCHGIIQDQHIEEVDEAEDQDRGKNGKAHTGNSSLQCNWKALIWVHEALS